MTLCHILPERKGLVNMVYIRIHIFIYIHSHMFVYVFAYFFENACMCMCTCMLVYVCKPMHVYACMNTQERICVFIRVRACLRVYVFVYFSACACRCVYTNVCTCIWYGWLFMCLCSRVPSVKKTLLIFLVSPIEYELLWCTSVLVTPSRELTRLIVRAVFLGYVFGRSFAKATSCKVRDICRF